ncbi:helix-turn-helix domain-containing protein [Streptomyces sp. NPDC004237]|uniref:helix-turn-helix domain-containing protein n=1 Tax=Streptomyces sp. NPDC004237 TaxID=3154455 RepID=UPI0033A95558
MTRADRRTLVRQHAADGLSQRQIARRLGISKDTVRRDLETLASHDEPQDEPLAEPDDEPDDPDAPQVSESAAPAGAPGDEPGDEPPAEPESPTVADRPIGDAPPALPRRIPARQQLVIDLDRSPTLRRALADLGVTGVDTEVLVGQAVVALAVGYRVGVARDRIQPDAPFIVRAMEVGPSAPARAAPRRPVPPAPPEGA